MRLPLAKTFAGQSVANFRRIQAPSRFTDSDRKAIPELRQYFFGCPARWQSGQVGAG
jgi:hypothetical protein